MDASTNALNWFEIPAADINRAKAFYEAIFGFTMETQEMMGMKMAFFPYAMNEGKVGGGLCESPYHTPAETGTIVYLNANPNLETVTEKIEAAGGKIAMPKMKISDDIGYMAFFIDTEGNRVALHSQQ
jgi:predicted enzyme related to lactoylglutathione lyase